MVNNLVLPNIRIFVFGTLRSGDRLDYYMEGSSPIGLYYTEGQLMKSENGNAYIEFSEKGVATIGELHHVNFYCLQRINHLETASGEFPKGYDLDLVSIWKYKGHENLTFNPEQKELAFFYRRRNEPIKIMSGDWTKDKKPLDEIAKYLKEIPDRMVYHDEVIQHIAEYLKE
jgi:gamma-glutamylcyclotransferase (GGCT)/AIG2-like uncharacterized protein YtfP